MNDKRSSNTNQNNSKSQNEQNNTQWKTPEQQKQMKQLQQAHSQTVNSQMSIKDMEDAEFIENTNGTGPRQSISKISSQNADALMQTQTSVAHANDGTFHAKTSEQLASFGGLIIAAPESTQVTMPTIQINNNVKGQQYQITKGSTFETAKPSIQARGSKFEQEHGLLQTLPDLQVRKNLIESIYENHKSLIRTKMPIQKQYVSGNMSDMNSGTRSAMLENSNSVDDLRKITQNNSQVSSKVILNPTMSEKPNQRGCSDLKSNKILQSSTYGDDYRPSTIGYYQTNHSFNPNYPVNTSKLSQKQQLQTNSLNQSRAQEETFGNYSNIFTDVPQKAEQPRSQTSNLANYSKKKDRYCSSTHQLQNANNKLKNDPNLGDRRISQAIIHNTANSKQNLLLFLNQKDQMLRKLKEKQMKYHLQKNVHPFNKSSNDIVSFIQAERANSLSGSQQDYPNIMQSLDQMEQVRKPVTNHDQRYQVENQNRSVIMEKAAPMKINDGNFGQYLDEQHDSLMSSQRNEGLRFQTQPQKQPQNSSKGEKQQRTPDQSMKLNKQLIAEGPLSIPSFEYSNMGGFLNEMSTMSIDLLAGGASKQQKLNNDVLQSQLQSSQMSMNKNYLKKSIQNSKQEAIETKIKEIERKRIQSARNELDLLELEFKQKEKQNQNGGFQNYDFNIAFSYFKQVNNNLFKIFMEPEPAGKKTVQLYSRQLTHFIHFLIKNIDQQLKGCQKYLLQGISNKDGQIKDQKAQIILLKQEIECLKTQLLGEENILSEERVAKTRTEIDNFFKNTGIIDAQITNCLMDNKTFYNIKELLDENKYSGAKSTMEEILKDQKFVSKLHKKVDETYIGGASTIDK